MLRQPADNVGNKIDQQHGNHHQHEHRESVPCNERNILSGHSLQHEEVKAHRRRNLRHLNDQHDKNTEPDKINLHRFNGRQQDAHRQHDHGNAIEETPQQDEKHRQRKNQRKWRKIQANDPLRHMSGQADVAHRQGQKSGPEQNHRNHAIQARAAEQAFDKGLPVQIALHGSHCQRADHAERRGFGRRSDAGVD